MLKKENEEKKKSKSFREDFSSIMQEDSALGRNYILKGLMALLIGVCVMVFFLIGGELITALLSLFCAVIYILILVYQLNELLTGKALCYSGTVIRTGDPNMVKRKDKKRIRPEVVFKNENGQYITFHPYKKNQYAIGDKIKVYAPNVSFVQTDDNSFLITNYYYVKTVEFSA